MHEEVQVHACYVGAAMGCGGWLVVGRSWALGPLARAVAGGLVAVAGALVLVAGRPRRHAVALGAAYPAVLEAVVVPARLGAPHPALAVAER